MSARSPPSSARNGKAIPLLRQVLDLCLNHSHVIPESDIAMSEVKTAMDRLFLDDVGLPRNCPVPSLDRVGYIHIFDSKPFAAAFSLSRPLVLFPSTIIPV